jgi:peptide/nickel transport system permease protein
MVQARTPAIAWRPEERVIGRGPRRRSPSLIAGSAILAILLAMAVFAPLLSRYGPIPQDTSHALLHPSRQHLLGTDQLGRDVWVRLLYGARIDLVIGFLAVLLPFVIGSTLGCLAGYFGGWTDTLTMRAVDVILAFPFFVLVIAIVFVLGPGTTSIFIALAVTDWVSYAWIVRAEILAAKRQEYVLAAQALGYSRKRIILRHLLPNVITQAIVYAMSDIVFAILAIVGLGYLGLGVPPPTPEWGSMIADGQQFITTNWQLATIPGIAVVVTGLALSLLGDGLADLLRPE